MLGENDEGMFRTDIVMEKGIVNFRGKLEKAMEKGAIPLFETFNVNLDYNDNATFTVLVIYPEVENLSHFKLMEEFKKEVLLKQEDMVKGIYQDPPKPHYAKEKYGRGWKWDESEDEILMEGRIRGLIRSEIAKKLGRNIGSCDVRFNQLKEDGIFKLFKDRRFGKGNMEGEEYGS